MTELAERGSDAGAEAQEQFLFFHLQTADEAGEPSFEGYALAMSDVAQIIRIPELNRVPLAGEHLLGVTNLRGSVLPVVSLRALVGLPVADPGTDARILVLRGEEPLGVQVDRVERVSGVEPDRVDRSDLTRAQADHDLLHGFIRPEAAEGSILRILSSAAIIEAGRAAEISGESSSGMASRSGAMGSNSEVVNRRQYVGFRLADQHYALAIQQVKEVVRVPDSPEPIAGAPGFIVGLLSLRNLMIPLVSLSTFYGLETEPPGRSARVLVLPVSGRDGGEFIGIIVDEITDVRTLAENEIKAAPDMLSGAAGHQDIVGLFDSKDESAALTAVLDARRLVQSPALKATTQETGGGERAMNAATDVETDDQQLVIFQLMAEEYGVDITAAKEILRVPDSLTRVPQADSFVEGVINLRGAVLPVIDLRRRFGLPAGDRNNQQRIIVLNLRGERTGFIVDSVREVRRVSRAAIEPAPELSAEQAALITDMANLADEERMILLLNPGRLAETTAADSDPVTGAIE